MLEYCDKLPGWPERVLTMQRNWIGKSYGCEVTFPLIGSDKAIQRLHHRQDNFSAPTFMLIAANIRWLMNCPSGKVYRK